MECPLTSLFEHTSIRALARFLANDRGIGDAAQKASQQQSAGDEKSMRTNAIAIVGMAGRFPGAADVDGFWNNLRDGVESIQRFTREELLASGLDPQLIDSSHYVPARAILDNVDQFDASFFGYTPREAELIDPQQRLFIECAWEALERAACDPQQFAGRIGVYGGCNINTYLQNIRSRPDIMSSAGDLQVLTSSDKDFIATRTSYKLDLRGPAVAVQTACSTSLVAVHQACQSLLNGECDMALAGGASVTLPIKRGYVYTEQGIASPDGHCRAFDKEARGTVGGDGVAVVALKRLDDALRDGDLIHAVIRGTAINNDGGRKVGFTAPSIEGQTNAISAALSKANVDPSTLDYVEAHGTGTELGDPIELAALKRAIPPRSDGSRCLIGSVKSNIGHLDAAAGAAGLIKTVTAIRQGQIPPVLHFTAPNPKLELEGSAFALAERLMDWPKPHDRPRRAGVSSFGMGGTNAHAVLEQAPQRAGSAAPARREQILLICARTPAALDAASARLAEHLRAHPQLPLADVAHTLRVGRRRFEHRRAVVAATSDDAVRALKSSTSEQSWTAKASSAGGVVFLFPGQGTQHVAMGRGLYDSEPVYRAAVDKTASLFSAMGLDVLPVLVPTEERVERLLERTSITQAALFTVEVALARLWMSWGIQPIACIGHSIGEISAAVVCESLTLEDAVKLVAERGRLMEKAPAGAMLAVPLPVDRVTKLLSANLWISAINAPSLCTVSGTVDAIEHLSHSLSQQGVECRRLRTSGAFHSGLMDEVARELEHAVSGISTRAPKIPYISNVTGDWISPQLIESRSYWGQHVRQAVRFAEGISRILSEKSPSILLEIGPGHTLGQLARAQFDPQRRQSVTVVTSMRHPTQTDVEDSAVVAYAIAQMAVRGVEPDWNTLEPSAGRQRVELPTYPFERKRYWIEKMPARASAASQPRASAASLMQKQNDVRQWLHTPQWRIESWRRSTKPGASQLKGQNVLLLSDGSDLFRSLRDELDATGANVTNASVGDRYSPIDAAGQVTLDPSRAEHWRMLASDLKSHGQMPHQIVHVWLAAEDGERPLRERVDRARMLGFDAIRHAAAAMSDGRALRLSVLTRRGCSVSGEQPVRAELGLVAGLCRVLPQEIPGLACQLIDIDPDSDAATHVLSEMATKRPEPLVAYRGGRRAVQEFGPVDPAELIHPLPLHDGGVYWITGGLGNVGLAIARSIATRCKAKLVLSSRSGLPPQEEWDSLLQSRPESDPIHDRLRKLRELEFLGATVQVVKMDLQDPGQLKGAVSHIEATLGPLRGVIHAAGDTAFDIFAPAHELTSAMSQRHFAPKVHGLIALDEALDGRELDIKLMTSSLASVFGGPKMAAYAAANAFMDAFAENRGWTSVNWDGWNFAGDAGNGRLAATAMTADEGAAAFENVLRLGGAAQVAVCTTDFAPRWERWVVNRGQLAAAEEASSAPADSGDTYERPQLENAFIAPRDDVEQAVAHMWSELIGVSNIGAEDDFFQLGGHSLMATQLLSRIRDAFRVEITLQQIFAAPTVSAIAQGIIAREAKPGQAMKIAGLLKKIRNMSPAEREQLLARQRGGTEKGAG
jgi:acyl transferase domain-containing protein